MKRLSIFLLLLLSQAGVVLAFPDPVLIGQKIATRRQDGAHALPYASSFGTVFLWIWTNAPADGTSIALPACNLNWPTIEFVGMDKICMVDQSTNFNEGHVITWDISNPSSPTRVEDFVFADLWMRHGDSIAVTNGGTFFVNYNHSSGTTILLDCAYRTPAGTWVTNRFSKTPFSGEIPTANLNAVEINGVFNIGVIRDSANCLAWLRVDTNLAEVSFTNHLIDGFDHGSGVDPLAADGEIPPISMRKDTQNNRVITMYPGQVGAEFACSGIYTIPVILSVDANVVTNAIMSSALQPPSYKIEREEEFVGFYRPEDIYYIIRPVDIAACVDNGFFLGSVSRGIIRSIPINNGEWAHSEDGWIAYRHKVSGVFTIEHLFPNPGSKITLHITNRP